MHEGHQAGVWGMRGVLRGIKLVLIECELNLSRSIFDFRQLGPVVIVSLQLLFICSRAMERVNVSKC